VQDRKGFEPAFQCGGARGRMKKRNRSSAKRAGDRDKEKTAEKAAEAAELDGANPLQYFWYILLPLLKVPMASLTVIFLPLIWNDFIHPFVYLDQNNTTILPLIQTFSGQYASNFQVIYTGVFMSVLPLVIVYILFRRWFVQGALAGAIK